MNLGAEPKKVVILGGLLLVAGVVLYINVFSGPSEPAPVRHPAAAPAPLVAAPARATGENASERRRVRTSLGEFKPRVGPVRDEDRPDPASIDPTIHFDLLAKLQKIEPESTGRNIFQTGAAPVTIAGEQKPIALPTKTPAIAVKNPPATAPAGPATPQPPPITFKYYGFKVEKASGRKAAFLLDGDDIMIAGENESVKNGRYKVMHIGVNSITIEDTQFKHSQTLQLEEIPG